MDNQPVLPGSGILVEIFYLFGDTYHNLEKKIIITNTVTNEDIELLRTKGVSTLLLQLRS